ncbi:hypothetical protein [Marinobacter nauticus]|uniref:hypothetical protein n=1 Tax=Marinobacter nauticus TaxID=2743 RepID=UPI001C97C593|nr:hypothetical protein [Marinobacter nauticus]MBY6220995.1 hypothetical protein [Marinobacter nauticus]
MFKKTLISLAVASSLGLTGCFDSGSSSENANPSPKYTDPAIEGKTWPIFNPATSNLPTPNDILFAQETAGDGTMDGSNENAITAALDALDGASTTAQFDIKLSGTIKESTVDGRPFVTLPDIGTIPNPEQTVYLLGLDFPGGDSLQNSSAYYTGLAKKLGIPLPESGVLPGETPTFDIGLSLNGALNAKPLSDYLEQFRVEVIDLDGGKDNAIRITPLKPLDPKKKYLVVVTNEILDEDGDPLINDPVYSNILGEDGAPGLISSRLAALTPALQSWEQLASGYFANVVNNTRPLVGLPDLTQENIAMALTFTTGGTEDVLEAATSPAAFFYKSGVTQTRQGAIAQYLATNTDAFLAMSAPEQYQVLATAAGTAVATNDATIKATAAGTAALLAGNGADFSNPEPRTITPVEATRVPVSLVNDDLAASAEIMQWGITLPYYLGIPTESDPSNLNVSWEASKNVGALIDASQMNEAGTTPPSDMVTFRYPFAAERGEVFAPLLIQVPTGASCSAPFDVVIYQHGIFGNRSHSLALGNQLAGQCFVTVAIDLPMHGIAPKLATGTLDPSLGLSVDVTNDGNGTFSESLLPMNERHFGWGQNNAGDPTRMVYSTEAASAVGSSAQFFLNLANLPAARDNLRQGVIDLLNLNASLVNLNGLDLDNADGDRNPATGGGDVDVGGTSNVYFVGHSLGGIIGTSFVTLANGIAQDPDLGNDNINPITATALVTPGAGVAKLLENSPSLGSTVLAGLAKANDRLVQGNRELELYLNVAQASLDSVDPLNFTSSLLETGTPVYLNEIYGDGSDPATQDQTIPVAADRAYAGEYTAPLGDAFPAPLAGTEPLFSQLGADTITGTGPTAVDTNAVRFTAGTHTTIIQPTNLIERAVFGDMAQNIISFFGSGGSAIQFHNANFVKQEAPTPENP